MTSHQVRLMVYDAWVFFTLLLFFASLLVLVAPVRLIDAVLGTKLVSPLVRLIEIIGNL